MFESLLQDVAGRFGLNANQAKSLLASLISLIFDRNGGGFSGFVQKFEQAGLGNLTKSWMGTGASSPLDASQLTNVLGSSVISGLASKLGLSTGTIGGGLAAMLPAVIRELAPGGKIPGGPPSALTSLLKGFGDFGDAAGNAAGAATAAVGSAARSTAAAAEGVAREATSSLGFLKWLIPLLIILGLIWWFMSRQPAHDTNVNVPATAASVAAATADAASNAASATANAIGGAAGAVATGAANLAASASSAAANALAALTPGNYTATQLTDALNLMNVNFATGSANIDPTSDAILKSAATAIENAPSGTQIEVGGYTDATGDAAANMKLSLDRANAVQARLVQLGVPAAMLTAKGYGEWGEKAASDATAAGRAENRSVRFTVIH